MERGFYRLGGFTQIKSVKIRLIRVIRVPIIFYYFYLCKSKFLITIKTITTTT